MAVSDRTTLVDRAARLFSRNEPKITYQRLPPGKWMRVVGWRHLVALLAVAFSLFPIVWMVSASINPLDTLSGSQLIPDGATLDNYRDIIENPEASPFITWLWASWRIALIVGLVSVMLTAMAAYAFSRFRFTGRRIGLMSLLAVQVFPQFLAFVALFQMLRQMGEVFPAMGLDTHLGLMLVYLGGAIGVNTFLIKGFMDSVPTSLDESAGGVAVAVHLARQGAQGVYAEQLARVQRRREDRHGKRAVNLRELAALPFDPAREVAARRLRR